MHKFVSNSHFCGGPGNLKGINYFDLPFEQNYFLTKSKILTKFKRSLGFKATLNFRKFKIALPKIESYHVYEMLII